LGHKNWDLVEECAGGIQLQSTTALWPVHTSRPAEGRRLQSRPGYMVGCITCRGGSPARTIRSQRHETTNATAYAISCIHIVFVQLRQTYVTQLLERETAHGSTQRWKLCTLLHLLTKAQQLLGWLAVAQQEVKSSLFPQYKPALHADIRTARGIC